MKTKKLWYGLLVGVASVWLAYACQNDVAPVEKAGQEAGTALVDKAKAYFESAIRQQVYTRGVADVYEEAQDEESGFIPSDYTPMWSRSFVAEEGNWKQVAAPVATFDKSYICTPDGEVDELAQAVVYREEAGETSCRMLVLWATDGRDAQTAVESFVGNAGQSDFTGVAWQVSLDGEVEKIEAYEGGQVIYDSQAPEGGQIRDSLGLDNTVVVKPMGTRDDYKEEDLPEYEEDDDDEIIPGFGQNFCSRCGKLKGSMCKCCPHSSNKGTCSICTPSSIYNYCGKCGANISGGNHDCPLDDVIENGNGYYCSNCGERVSVGLSKCPRCGTKI